MEKTLPFDEIERAKNGDDAALAAIISKKMPVIRLYAHRAGRPGLDFDDAVQEGLIGLFNAINSYNTKGGASFATYSSSCIQNAIYSASRAAGRQKHAPLDNSVPLDQTHRHAAPTPEEQAIANEQVALTLEKARATLSVYEKAVLGLAMEGYSNAHIAKALGKNTKSIENALLRARNKLR